MTQCDWTETDWADVTEQKLDWIIEQGEKQLKMHF
jgi:hypothetical protein